jgi:hypothetical protein
MSVTRSILSTFILLGCIQGSYASDSAGGGQHCPDPNNTSLAWGEVPTPWEVSPLSQRPQGEEGTKFKKANVLVPNGLGRGVTCTYRNSVGNYTIIWTIPVKQPDRLETSWQRVNGGYACWDSVENCIFYVGSNEQ